MMSAILREFLAREEHRFEGAEATSGIRGYVGQELPRDGEGVGASRAGKSAGSAGDAGRSWISVPVAI